MSPGPHREAPSSRSGNIGEAAEELRVRAESRPIATGRKTNGTDVARRVAAVPAYVMAEAETTPLPKIVIVDPPPPVKRRGPRRLGDLPMRVIYRLVAAALTVVVAGAAAVAFVVIRHGDRPVRGIAAPAPSASGAAPSIAASAPPPSSSASPLTSPAPDPSAAPARVETRGLDPLVAALADPRVRKLPPAHRLGRLPGRSVRPKRWIKDGRSGIAVVRLGGGWRTAKASPFATRQVLPLAKGDGHRALLVTCPVPTLVRRELRDTAVVAARWTLNHQPHGAVIRWVASQPVKVGRADGWLLAYRTAYSVKGRKHTSMDAVVLVQVHRDKPAMMFISVPDGRRSHWRDVNTAVAPLQVLMHTRSVA
jgi:hypothetical protein